MRKAPIIISALVVILVLGCVGFIRYEIYTPASSNSQTTTIEIAKGSSLPAIGKVLQQAGAVRNAMAFTAYARFSGKGVKLKAGIYTLPLNQSVVQVVDRLVSGKGSGNDISVTIPEGYTNAQILAALQKAGVDVSQQDFEAVVSSVHIGESTHWMYDGKPESADQTGYLFPDTYNFFGNSSAQQVVDKMVNNLESKLTETMHQEVAASGYNFYQVLTLASIVEKEVRTPEERRIVAGIFLHRLADHYPLESDATLNFITGKKNTRPSASDVAVDSPYNSYAHAGLPPTPICNPGIDAIAAVLEPTQTDYYFFLTKPDGTAVYSVTYDEHLQQKAQYYP